MIADPLAQLLIHIYVLPPVFPIVVGDYVFVVVLGKRIVEPFNWEDLFPNEVGGFLEELVSFLLIEVVLHHLEVLVGTVLFHRFVIFKL